jgi:hypothetical protein
MIIVLPSEMIQHSDTAYTLIKNLCLIPSTGLSQMLLITGNTKFSWLLNSPQSLLTFVVAMLDRTWNVLSPSTHQDLQSV